MDDKNDAGDAGWVLDSLVGFLKSPVWNLSVLNFIEQKSVIFEPETEDQSDQNETLEQEYSKIFNEFKEMVDTLIGSHMEDLQISPEQFENACLEANDNLGSRLHSILFEQLWAAFNYRIFKRMMIQRNIDLQLQALELLGQKLNVSTSAMNASSLSPQSQVCEEEFELMRELFKRSSISTDANNKPESDEHKSIENADTATKTVDETIVMKLKETEPKTNGHTGEEDNQTDSVQLRPRQTSSARLSQSALIEKVLHNNDTNQNDQIEHQQQVDNEQKMLLLLGNGVDGQQIGKEELEKRQNYLRAQRDKLIELKRKERSKQIVKVGDEQQQNNRPKSAKALRSTLKKSFPSEDDEKNEQVKMGENDKENSGTGYRRMLAAKLKADLIGGSIGDVILTTSTTNEN